MFFFNVLLEKLHGNKAGALIVGDINFQKILQMDENKKTDYNATTTPSPILTTLVTGVKSGGDATSKMRLMRLLTTYKKNDGQGVIHTIIDPDTGQEKAITDSVNAANDSDYKDYKKRTDGMTGDLKMGTKFQYKIQNCDAFDGAVILARAEDRGSR